MKDMFYGCRNLISLDLSNFDTSNVRSMYYMFDACSNLKTLDLSHWDTSNVTDMGYMFSGCSSLTSLDVSKFDTSNVTDMNGMFSRCSSLETIYCDNDWKFMAICLSSSWNMFTACMNLVGAISYNSSKTDATYANPTTGYFTKVPTGIEDIENDEENAVLQDGILYDMSGRPVGDVSIQRIEELHLQPGVYILNGKKIMVR